MIEATVPVKQSHEPVAEGMGAAGATLRQAREAAGIQLETLAATLKIPVWKLEAVEADRWDLLPDAVFARALAASICRTLKVDSVQLLGKLPMVKPKLLTEEQGINAPFRGAPGVNAGGAALFHLSRPLVMAVFALSVGALILAFMPSLPSRSPKPSSAPIEEGSKPDVPLSIAANQAVPNVSPAPEVPASAMLPPGPLPTGTEAVQAPVLTGSTTLPTEVSVSAVTSGESLQARSSETTILFKTTGPSWIQVTDAKGAVTLRKLMEAGESATATGVFPLAVLVGRVDATTVEIGGKAFDMTPIARENVARFEVKR